MLPIGPKARHLNRDFAYADGKENQLAHWTRLGVLAGRTGSGAGPATRRLGRPQDRHARRPRPRLARDQLRPLPQPRGPCRNSGLDLLASQQNPTSFGIMKPPVAAGIGSGGLPTTSFRASPINRSSPSASPRPIPAS